MKHGRKLVRFHGKTDKTRDAVGRLSCQSSLLSDPNAKFFCGNLAKATKNKKNKEGRHVGLDFYDLLIEALYSSMKTVCGPYCAFSLCGPHALRVRIPFAK
jgi:hypothetical protein